MRKLSLGKLLTIIVSSFALIYGPVSYGAITVGELSDAAAEIYSAEIIASTNGATVDNQVQLDFIACKSDQGSTTDFMKGIFLMQALVGVSGYLHTTANSILKIDTLSLTGAAGDGSLSTGSTTDLFSGYSNTNTSYPTGTSDGWDFDTNTASQGPGCDIGDAANLIGDADVNDILKKSGFVGGTAGAVTATSLEANFANITNFIKQGADGTNGRRAVNGTDTVDWTLETASGSSITLNSDADKKNSSPTDDSDIIACQSDFDGSLGSDRGTCPYYLVNVVSKLVDIAPVLHPNLTDLTLTYTTSMTAPTRTVGDFASATVTYATHTDHIDTSD